MPEAVSGVQHRKLGWSSSQSKEHNGQAWSEDAHQTTAARYMIKLYNVECKLNSSS